MADLAVVPASVKMISGVSLPGIAGETLIHGKPIYQTNGSWFQCDANDTADKAVCEGIVLTPALMGEKFIYAKSNAVLDLGVELTVAEIYVLSNTVGGITTKKDLLTISHLTILGVGLTASTFKFKPIVSGVLVSAGASPGLTADLSTSVSLASTITSSSTVTAEMTATMALATTITSSSTVTADLSLSSLASTMAGTSGLTAELSTTVSVSSTTTGSSILYSDLTVV